MAAPKPLSIVEPEPEFEDVAWRDTLVTNLKTFTAQLKANQVEYRAKKELEKRSKLGKLRAGRYTGVKNERGAIVDLKEMYAQRITLRLSELEFDIEMLELTIEFTKAELAGIPGTEDTPVEG